MVLIVIVIVALAIFVAVRIDKNRRREESLREHNDLIESQKRVYSNINKAIFNAENSYGEAVRLMFLATDHVLAAEEKYEANLFAPFWDVIEDAIKCLKIMQGEVDDLQRASEYYKQFVEEYKSYGQLDKNHKNIPEYPAQPVSLEDIEKQTSDVVSALNRFIEMGQSNYNFASIYEQRKTRRTLEEGFSDLDAALHETKSSLTHSLGELSNELSDMADDVSDAIEIGSAGVAAAVAGVGSKVGKINQKLSENDN